MNAACNSSESSRSEARRAQILSAARDCFRRHGFHGASISQICRQAGMSAGHIYHNFDNKEAIIAAIVEQDLSRLLTMTAELRAAENIEQTMTQCAAEGVHENLDPDTAALKLEIVAEGSRNPRVAEIVRDAERCCHDSMVVTVREMRRSLGLDTDEAWIDGLVEFFATLYDGLLVRSVRNPGEPSAALLALFSKVILDLVKTPSPLPRDKP